MVVAVGVTTMLAPVAPVLQVTVPAQPVAVNVIGSLLQTDAFEAVSVGAVPTELTVMRVALDAGLVHSPILQIAVYEVEAVGDTTIEAPVAPFDQFTVPKQPEAVNVTDSPEQITCLLALITGAVGVETLTVTKLELPLKQTPFLQVAV